MEDALTAEQAAKILGVSRATVTRWRQQGALAFIRIDNKFRYPRRAVEELEVERNQGLTVSDLKGKVANLSYEVERLKRYMNFLLFKLQVTEVRMELPNSDLLDFYQSCDSVPRQVSAQYAYRWLQVAQNITEIDYERITALTGDSYPWRKAFNHADEMMSKIKHKKKFRSSTDLQQIAQNLALVQQEIRKCGLIMLTTKPVNIPIRKRFDLIVSGTGEPHEIDPDEMMGGLNLPGMASEADQKKLSRLSQGSKVSPTGLPEGRR